jgi:hypothetical protein
MEINCWREVEYAAAAAARFKAPLTRGGSFVSKLRSPLTIANELASLDHYNSAASAPPPQRGRNGKRVDVVS